MENPMQILLIAIIVLVIIDMLIHLLTANKNKIQISETLNSSLSSYRQEVNSTLLSMNTNNQNNLYQGFQQINTTLTNNRMAEANDLEQIRSSMENSLSKIREANDKKLDEMRQTVDEKLQKTLDTKLSESFQLIQSQLQEVHQGLGEMQSLANGVGDLKKVLSNVKTRGILGEYQLDAILKEIMAPSQYDTNINTIPNSRERVEFAIKLPADDGNFIYLPIDSKFPNDSYANLLEASEEGDKNKIESCKATLKQTLKNEAKDIHNKYVQVPYTTEFAIMFLPTEGLYSQVCNLGMNEVLQREYKVVIAGPSTMAALLNSLQMGFKTLAIQKRSSEVWNILGSVKSEFENFEAVLTKAQKNLQSTSDELDKLVGARTRSINRKLREVQSNNMYNLIEDNKQEEA